MALGNRSHQKKPQACSPYLRQGTTGDPIEALENAFELCRRDSDAAIRNSQHQPFLLF